MCRVGKGLYIVKCYWFGLRWEEDMGGVVADMVCWVFCTECLKMGLNRLALVKTARLNH